MHYVDIEFVRVSNLEYQNEAVVGSVQRIQLHCIDTKLGIVFSHWRFNHLVEVWLNVVTFVDFSERIPCCLRSLNTADMLELIISN